MDKTIKELCAALSLQSVSISYHTKHGGFYNVWLHLDDAVVVSGMRGALSEALDEAVSALTAKRAQETAKAIANAASLDTMKIGEAA